MRHVDGDRVMIMRTDLTEEELGSLQEIISPYFTRISELEQQIMLLRTALNSIAKAYLRGLGINGDMDLNTKTGAITRTSKEDINGH